ncbi:NYN domain-containing protein [Candidatus Uhrbacteria bacterium]|nr:NYN domain-containing protein [Candidatus Uhrbacteria bacterium]
MNDYIESIRRAMKGRVFVAIDAANLERSVQDMWVNPKDITDVLRKNSASDLRYRVDYKKIKEFFQKEGSVEEIKFYTPDFQTVGHRKFLSFLSNLTYRLNTKPLKNYADHTPELPHRKANFDVEIAVDAVFRLQSYDTFILFSGDCDFEYLIKFLRGQGKIVIIFSRAGHIAKELPPAATRYFDIVDFRKELLKMDVRRAKNPA